MRHRFSLTWPVPAALASLLPFSLFLLLQFITLATAQTNPQAPPPHLPERTYLDTVCRPPILHMGDVVAPCISIETTEALCYPNGTTALHLDAHAQCLCRGSFFAEWTACRACLSLHGLLDDADRSFYQAVAMSASSVLCGFLTEPAAAPAPTTIFKAIFSSIAATLPGRSASGQGGSLAATAAGAASPGPDDKAPYQTEVRLYYTASGPQGPGPITGPATAATATGLQLDTGTPTLPGAPGPETLSQSGAVGSVGPNGTEAVAGSTSTPSSSAAIANSWRGLRWMPAIILVGVAGLIM
ncbi:hypothetical protein MGG_12313 [Pyricularia oryzae 70-15]|uniref:Collagen-like protein Mcl1 n=1 Tax=Pyricularia oryzae (strain 70-15 / ATCC MYA-4617 / FGSC 8958) TaxID=242507 RepID=G4MZ99_PYRO7|nr:uncharacterized protein MGG_12313 [Pyricularia oryzae 70-15]EHA55372.1 hypothetical protein MGG_12313 [Pyricularia oryzae 70-15]